MHTGPRSSTSPSLTPTDSGLAPAAVVCHLRDNLRGFEVGVYLRPRGHLPQDDAVQVDIGALGGLRVAYDLGHEPAGRPHLVHHGLRSGEGGLGRPPVANLRDDRLFHGEALGLVDAVGSTGEVDTRLRPLLYVAGLLEGLVDQYVVALKAVVYNGRRLVVEVHHPLRHLHCDTQAELNGYLPQLVIQKLA